MNNPRDYLLEALPLPESFLPFEQFMEAALYHPEFGYYCTAIKDIGRRGDFSTSATLDPVLGEVIALWAQQAQADIFSEQPLNLIEIGAGNAQLAKTILSSLPEARYHIVEHSTPLRIRQAEELGHDNCQWHDSPADALDACDGNALVFSNELVDAFPCRILEWDGNRWNHVGLERKGETLSETNRPADEMLPTSCTLPDPQLGQRVEIHESYFKWIRTWNAHWKKGALLTIDYGGSPNDIYFRRPEGTIRGYHRQQRIQGAQIYHHMGQQDLTADVNFDCLQQWSIQLGWENLLLETQREFILRQLPEVLNDPARQPACEYLLDPQGPGGAFKVLENRKG